VSRRPLALLALAVACAAGALAVWIAAFELPAGRRLDGDALDAFTVVARPPHPTSIHDVVALANLLPLVAGMLALVAVTLLRRRWLMAAIVPLILLAANGATQLLKPGLAHERLVELYGVRSAFPASWPSGHSTVAMSLALCAVLVVGPRLRPLAALLGAGYAIGVGCSLVALQWHLPSDVLGGFFVAATFTLLGAAALAALERRFPAAAAGTVRERDPAAPFASFILPASLAATTFIVCCLALMLRHPHAPALVASNPTMLLAVGGIAALGIALTTSLTLALRR
jgi:membrane-associated phospholipid phosphatase